MKTDRLVVVLGPTATGKTALGVKLALALGGEVISGDSRLIYRGLDIGTAKPTLEERRGIPHHLIDILDLDQPFSVAVFQRLAAAAITETRRRGKLPILVGGTGLYLRALLRGFNFPAGEPDPDVRRRLLAELRERGPEELHHRLQVAAPARAGQLHPRDWRRVVRAIETGGVPAGPSQSRYDGLLLGLQMPREALYPRIEARVERMLEAGLVEEVRGLLKRGYPPQAPGFETIGYREVIAHLEGKVPWAETVRLIKRNTRRYAKRQLTWFGREEGIHWLPAEPEPGERALEMVARWSAEGVE